MARWSKGRVTLLGDACHPTLPFLGQGGVMAIEDGYVIAACLAKYFADPAAALARYEEIRASAPRRWCEARTRTAAPLFSPALAAKDAIAAEVAREWQVRLRERFEWLYAYDATAVAI